ncbi:L,D-transpeptidase [Rhodoligotrophos defluvii]|uniref:L,D-transpeptidase n=1 Tax=Rhodoligotrophos defluvii TaxID=2561934 RepID=UPI0010C9D3F3|nr:L,D-transpeptidase [Rhodoligotrophos defluvii]
MVRIVCAGVVCVLFIMGALFAGEASAQTTRFNFTTESGGLASKYKRQVVSYTGPESPGTIIIDTRQRFLFFVLPGGQAVRYGVGVGREGFSWSGEAVVERKQEWPRWFPPAEMIARDPKLEPYRNGMDGGPENPLGARALYLYKDGKDTLFRIHGTAQPWSIGQNVSSGCIRLLNEDIIDLYERVPIGTTVIVR